MEEYYVHDNTYDGVWVSNKHANWFHFPKRQVTAGDIIYLYSGEGTKSKSALKNSEASLHKIYWQLKRRVWNDKGDTAYLLKIRMVQTKPVNQPKPKVKKK